MDRVTTTSHVVTCIDMDIQNVEAAIDAQLKVWKKANSYVKSLRRMSSSELSNLPSSLSGRLPNQFYLYTPVAKPDGTVFLTNKADGGDSLIWNIVPKLDCVCYRFYQTSTDIKYPCFGFKMLDVSGVVRVIRSMLDGDRWDFYQKGEPLAIEDPQMYHKHHIKDRVTAEYVFSLADRLGWPIDRPQFWRADGLVIHYQEHRDATNT